MATNRSLEMIVGATYPNSMRHLQQLIMDAEACAKNYGKKSLFGKDKFEPSFYKFMATIGACVHALAADPPHQGPRERRGSNGGARCSSCTMRGNLQQLACGF